MARDIDLSKKLSKEDVEWLSSRYPEPYVQRQIELAGGVKGQKSADTQTKTPETPPETASETPETPEEGVDGGSADEAANGSEEDVEDLIGSETAFNPSDHTADKVVEYLKTANDEEKSRVLAAEAADKARSTVLNA